MGDTIASLLVKIGLDPSGLEKGLQGVEGKLQSFGNGMASIGEGFSKFVTAPLLLAGGGAIKAAADMETFEVALTTMLGSADQAKETLGELSDFAASTPFEFPEIAQAARSLLAFGTEAGVLQETLRTVGDVAAGVGAPLNDIAVIYGKAQVAGRLFAEDINQLTERGIPIISELAKQFGVSEGEVRKLVEQGQVGFPQLQKAFQDLTGEGGRFNNMMEAQSQTFWGLVSTLKDNVMEALRDVGKVMIDSFDLKDKLQGAIDAVGQFSATLKEFISSNPELTKLGFAIAGVAAAVGPLLFGIGKFISFIPALKLGLKALTTGFGPWGLAITAVAAGALLLYENWDKVLGFLEQYAPDVLKTLTEAWESVVGSVEMVIDEITGTFEKVVASWQAIWDEHGDTILDVLGRAWDQVVNVISTGLELGARIIQTVMAAIAGDWKGVWNGLRGVVDTVWDFIKKSVLYGVDAVLAGLQNLLGFIPGMEERIQKARDKIAGIIDAERVKAATRAASESVATSATSVQGSAVQVAKAQRELTQSFQSEGASQAGAAKGAASEVQEAYARMEQGMASLGHELEIGSGKIDANAAEARILEKAYVDLREAGLTPLDPALVRISTRLDELRLRMQAAKVDTAALGDTSIVLRDKMQDVGLVGMDGLSGKIRDLENTIKSSQSGNVFANMWGAAIGTANNLFRDFGEQGIGGLIKNITGPLTGAFTGGGGLVSTISNAVGIGKGLLGTLSSGGIGGVISSLTGAGGLGSVITSVLGAAGPWGMAASVGLQIMQKLGVDMGDVWNGIKGAASAAWDGIKGAASAAGDAIKWGASTIYNFYKGIYTGIFNVAKDVFGGITNAAGAAWDGMKRAASATWDVLKSGAMTVFNFYKDVYGAIIGGAGDVLKAIGGGAIDIVEAGAGVIKDIGNWAGGGIKKIGGWLGFSQGGIVEAPETGMPAVLHGREAVIPLESTTAMRTIAQSVSAAMVPGMMPGGGGAGMSQTIIVQLDSNTLVRAVAKGHPTFLRVRGLG